MMVRLALSNAEVMLKPSNSISAVLLRTYIIMSLLKTSKSVR